MMRTLTVVLAGVVICVALGGVLAEQSASGPYGDVSDLKVAKDEDRADVKTVPPPQGAVVLFDGKNLDQWTKRKGKDAAAWKLVPPGSGGGRTEQGENAGAMQVNGTGDVVTREKFAGPFKLHVEFRVPYMPKASGQGRGNSGVYVQGRYEVQVLDSYGLQSKNNDCGGIYGVSAPLVNACKAPTVWQSYDIDFQPPQCENGKKVAPAVVTVHQNGVKIQDNVKITVDNTTAGMGGDPCTPGPILLQDHGNPVQYRNIWLLPGKQS